MERMRNWLWIARDFVVFLGEQIWIEAVYVWKSLVVLAKWRVPFLDWVKLVPTWYTIYGVWLLATSFEYGYHAYLGLGDGYVAGAGGYFIGFIWYVFWGLSNRMNRRMLQITESYGDAMAEVAERLLRDNKLMREQIKSMEQERADAVEQQKQPGQVEVAPTTGNETP